MATTILPTYNYTTGTSDAIPTSLPMANAYKYDQLNRIAQSNSFTNFDATSNNWTNSGAIANMYKTSYTYDANGNIKNLQRYNAAGVKFDDMDYKYDVQGSKLIRNKLYHVNDAIASGIHTADIDDQLGFTTTNITTSNNYTYDEIGNLKQDKTEEILEIKWTVSGKIKKIIRTGISTKPDLEYVYDAMGNRIAKILKPDGSSLENGGTDNPTQWTYTYYVRDAPRNQFKFVLLHKFRIDRPAAFYAGGNIMANYQKSTSNSITSFKLIERSIYGSSRLGIDKTTIDLTASITPPTILNHNLGLKNYELSNHLGNVATVISDRKIPRSVLGANIDFYMPDIVSATDYYPFGMTMQERTFSAGGEAYRFGFNGKENDDESNTQDYGMRIYDGRLGRFLSVDPLSKEYPWNSTYAFAEDDVIRCIDMDGLEKYEATAVRYDDCGYVVSISVVDEHKVADSPTGVQIQYTIYDLPRSRQNDVHLTNSNVLDGSVTVDNAPPSTTATSNYFEFGENQSFNGMIATNNGLSGPAFMINKNKFATNLVVSQNGAGTTTTATASSNIFIANINFIGA